MKNLLPTEELKPLPFADVSMPGGKTKHPVTLFKLFTKPFDIAENIHHESFAEQVIYDAVADSEEILRRSGIELGHRQYRVKSGKVVPFLDNEKDMINAFSLIGAIEKRDKNNGQTADWLAAYILNLEGKIKIASGNGTPWQFILETAMQMQHAHFQIFLLSDVQAAYSAGKGRGKDGNSMRESFGVEAEELFKKYHATGKPKETCYANVARDIAAKYPNEQCPKASTVKEWFKGRRDF